MKPALQVVSGPGHILLGYRLLLRPGVRRYVVLPLLANTALYALGAWAAFTGLEAGLERWVPDALHWLRWLLYPLLALALLVLGVFTFTMLANLMLAPFNGLLSARVEHMLSGSEPSGSGLGAVREMWRSVRLELRRLGYIAVRLLAVFLLGFIPVVGIVAAPLGLVLGAWLLAMEFAGNALGNWGYDLEQQRAFLRRHRWPFLGFGFATMGLALVPVVNFALVPAAVAGSTALCLSLRERGADAGIPAQAGLPRPVSGAAPRSPADGG